MPWPVRPNMTPYIDNKETGYLFIVSLAEMQNQNVIKCFIIYLFPNYLCNVAQFLVFQCAFLFPQRQYKNQRIFKRSRIWESSTLQVGIFIKENHR